MNLLFVTAHPYLPQMVGGLQTSTDQLCRHLVKHGHRTAVLSALMPDDALGRVSRFKLRAKKLLRSLPATRDQSMSYPVWRAWHPWEAVESVVNHIKPDLIVVMASKPAKMGLAACPSGVPIMLQLQDVEFDQHGGDISQLSTAHAVANSRFTAEAYRTEYGIQAEVIYPFIDTLQYAVQSTRETVTFINPHKFKGLPVALATARACPEIPFVFVETWPLKDHERASLHEELAGLPNITLLPPQKDVRPIYAKTKILLAPSLWNEGYGRVVSEAQLSGIPAIASIKGGLPEAVGDGGLLLDPEGDAEHWISAVKRLWTDDVLYDSLSRAALAHAQRPELSIEYHVNAWEKALKTAIARGSMAGGHGTAFQARVSQPGVQHGTHA